MRSFGVILCGTLFLLAPVFGDEVEDRIRQAREAIDGSDEDVAAAVRSLEELWKSRAEDPRPLPLLAYLLVHRQGELELGADVLVEYLGARGGDDWALDLMSELAFRALEKGDAALARNCAKFVKNARPQSLEDRYLWARASYRMRMRGSVRAECRSLIRDFPSYAPPYWLLAKVLEDEARYEEAAEVYRGLLREHSADVGARLSRASLLLWQLRDFDGAAEEYRSALALAGDDEAAAVDARSGLALVEESIDRRERLATQGALLHRLLLSVLAGWVVVLLVLARLIR